MHLKTGVNYIEDNNMLVSGEFVDKPDFAQYNKVVVPAEEAYGANCIWVNGTVIVAEGYPTVLKAVQDLGYKTLVVDTSEYRKVDGGLCCLSTALLIARISPGETDFHEARWRKLAGFLRRGPGLRAANVRRTIA